MYPGSWNGSMHRTQISLENAQYDFLIRESRCRKVSLSELIRQLVTQHMATKPEEDDPIESLAGMVEGPGGYGGRDHDYHLYGWSKE